MEAADKFAEVVAEVAAEVAAKMAAEVAAKAKTDAEATINAEATANAEVDTKAKANAKADTETDAREDAKVNAKADAKDDVKVDVEVVDLDVDVAKDVDNHDEINFHTNHVPYNLLYSNVHMHLCDNLDHENDENILYDKDDLYLGEDNHLNHASKELLVSYSIKYKDLSASLRVNCASNFTQKFHTLLL